MTTSQFHTLRPGDVVTVDTPTGRLTGRVAAWLDTNLLVRWGHGRQSYTMEMNYRHANTMHLLSREEVGDE